MLEYANTRDLVEEVTKIIRRVRPDVVLFIDPGSEYVRWHKTDYRMAANNTLDAIRAPSGISIPISFCTRACSPFWCLKNFTTT